MNRIIITTDVKMTAKRIFGNTPGDAFCVLSHQVMPRTASAGGMVIVRTGMETGNEKEEKGL